MILKTTFDLKFIGVLAIVFTLLTKNTNYINFTCIYAFAKCLSLTIAIDENLTFLLLNIMHSQF